MCSVSLLRVGVCAWSLFFYGGFRVVVGFDLGWGVQGIRGRVTMWGVWWGDTEGGWGGIVCSSIHQHHWSGEFA
jgi:hypothetical protein